MVRIFLFLSFVIFSPLTAMNRAKSTHSLGVRTIEYFDRSRNRPIIVEIWYPTTEQGPFDQPSDDIWIHPREVRNAPFFKSKSKHPLLLMSHGHRGGRREASWLAEAMVQAGYIVAAVDHYGDMRFHFDLLSSIRFWNRPLDFTFLLDQFEKEEGLRNIVDFERIGFIGYSLGGMTGLALAGGEAKNVRQTVCKMKWYSINRQFLDRFDLSPAERSYKETRIKAMLLLCPAVFVYTPESFKQITIPVGLVAAIGDEVLPFREHAYQIIQHLIPAKLKMLREEISHYAFMNRITDTGKLVLHKTLQSDPSCCDRISLHKEVSGFAVDFFRSAFNLKTP